jgi:hypothetical protein
VSIVESRPPEAGDVIAAMSVEVAAALPLGTIMEMQSDLVATVVYKPAPGIWTASGFSTELSDEELSDFTNTRAVEWIVVRVGRQSYR